MRKLTELYNFEVIDDEVILYEATDWDYTPITLDDVYVSNAFSLQMLNEKDFNVRVNEISEEHFNSIAPFLKSAIGHQDTASVLNLECNRENLKLNQGDFLIVAQLEGGRLPEGATTLPDGFKFKYLLLEVL